MEDLHGLARLLQIFGCLVEVLRQDGSCELAEFRRDVVTLSQPLHVWMLLSGCFEVAGHQVLSAQSILVQSEVKEGLLFVEVSSAFSVF
jgi:hypothetical protein